MMKCSKRFFLLFLALSLSTWLLPACGGSDDSTPSEDGDREVSEPDSSEPETESDGDLESEGDSVGEEEEESQPWTLRVHRLEEGEEGIGGPAAHARPGDYILENKTARFLIQGAVRPRSWVPYGGTLVDADVVRDGAPGEDLLNEVSVIVGILRAFCAVGPDSFEIVKDGSDGLEAELAVTGKDCGIPVVDMVFPMKPLEYDVRLNYRLKADDRALYLTTTVLNNGPYRTASLGDGIVWNRRLRVLTPGFGWGGSGLAQYGEFETQIAIGEKVAYGFMSLEGTLKVATDQAEILPMMGKEQKVQTHGEAAWSRLFVVGRTVEEVRARLRAEQPVEWPTLTVSVTRADPSQDAGSKAELLVLDEAGIPVTQGWIGEAASLPFILPAGTYRVAIREPGRPEFLSDPVLLGETDASLSVELPATGRVQFAIGGDHFDGSPREGLPCLVTIHAGADAAADAPILRRVFSKDGRDLILLEPGTYTLIASRGFEYELVRQSLTVDAGQTASFSGALERVVDTAGWVIGDLHLHTALSIDAEVPDEQRVIQLAATGAERGPVTNHDMISDLQPYVESLGLTDYLRLTSGDEVSPPGYHCNGYPMTDSEERPTYFGVYWHQGYDETGAFKGPMEFPQIWAQMRETFHTGVIQINHPRDGQGYLSKIGYDPALGIEALEPGVFDDNFDAIELINGGDIGTTLEAVLADWYSFLNQGLLVAGVGTSDSHTESDLISSRTYIRTGADDPNQISDEQFVDALTSLRAQATTGPFLSVSLGEAEIGDLHTGAGPYVLRIKVQAPSWMPVDWVRVVVNGAMIQEIPVVEGSAVVRFEQTVDLPASEADFWVVVLAGAPEKTMLPVSGKRVLSVANPIFVDVDGGGYVHPGLPAGR